LDSNKGRWNLEGRCRGRVTRGGDEAGRGWEG
jgi:hypothetical protein